MLRITQLPVSAPARAFRLEGKLVGPWLEELRQACGTNPDLLSILSLDLSGMRFVDEAGAKYLRSLVGQGVQITNCSSFVIELLKAPVKEAS
ncbi:MAG TPA: hypothetical protein VGN12_05000 [Pirellulales bacterium]|jgi:hypothetical protein